MREDTRYRWDQETAPLGATHRARGRVIAIAAMVLVAGATALALSGSAPEEAGAGFDPWNDAARYEIAYRAEIGAEPGQRVRLWMPLPASNAAQRVLEETIDAPWPHRITRDDHANRLLYVERPEGASGSATVVVRAVVERRPWDGSQRASGGPPAGPDPARYLSPQRRIPLDGPIRQIAEQESRGKPGDAEKIRAFYDYVVGTMQYSKKGKGWGNGDAVWACTSKYGNCTDFHSLFIGMARSQGIPARFVIGFPIPSDRAEGDVGGYHCWAEVFDPARGWLPLDSSEARKSGRVDAYFGQLPSDRIEFTAGRDLVLEPRQDGEPLNYLVYPYAEIDGQPVEKLAWSLHFRRLAPVRTAQR